MLAGQHPFDHDSDSDKIITRVLRSSPQPLAMGDSSISESARDLTKRLLNADPDLRLGAEGGTSVIMAHLFYADLDWDALLRRSLSAPQPQSADIPVYPSETPSDYFSKFGDYSRLAFPRTDSMTTQKRITNDAHRELSPVSQKLSANLRHRTAMLTRYFALRTHCCVDNEAWASVLDDVCVHSQPKLPYRPQYTGSSRKLGATQRVFLIGIEDIVADNLAARSASGTNQVRDLEFALVDVIHDQDQSVSMFQWSMRSRKLNTACMGGGRATFSTIGHIKTMDIVIDIHGFMEKLARAEVSFATGADAPARFGGVGAQQ